MPWDLGKILGMDIRGCDRESRYRNHREESGTGCWDHSCCDGVKNEMREV